MPQLGTGIVPGSGAVASQLEATIRRAFVKPLVVQMYQATPVLSGMLGNSAMAMGGVSSVTVPVQGSALTTTQATGFSGSFNVPQTQTGIQNAEFNLCMMVTPIPFLGTEAMLQLDHSVVPILEARMNDAGNGMVDYLATKLSNNATAGLDIQGFPAAIDNGTANSSYGGIPFSGNSWWEAYVPSITGDPAISRALMLQYISGLAKWSGGEMPTFGVCGFGTWVKLAQDYMGLERYNYEAGSTKSFDNVGTPARSGFTALMVGGVPIFADPYFAEGTVWLVNTRYLSFYIHQRVNFAFTGFSSMLPNAQLGYIGALVTVLNLVNSKPKSCAQLAGFSYTTL